MFSDINERIQETKDQLRRKQKYEEHLHRITEYLKEEKAKRDQLKVQLEKEKQDVARLEGFSLTNIFYSITGRKLEKLDQEQQEVLAAKLKYKEALETIADIEIEKNEYKMKLDPLMDSPKEYERILHEKEQLIHDTNSVWSVEYIG